MGWHGGFSLDEATRRSWYSPETVLQELEEGMTFADIGCGDGYFTVLAAKKVGEKGKVYSVDIDPVNIQTVKNKAQTEGLLNITALVGNAEDTVLCQGCLDMVLYSMDLHDFSDAGKVLRNAKSMLKPTGCVVDVDWKKMQMPFGPPFAIRFSEEHVAGLLRDAGFNSINVRDIGVYHYLVLAKVS